MPRKKKRSTLQRKPSLVFIESPVHVQRNVPSPVFCARDPPTADTVQVDDIHRLPWVSPQFRHGYTPGVTKDQRQSRRRRKSIACLRNINKENSCTTNGPLRRATSTTKFRSLRFINDPSVNVSEVDDVHITVDSDTVTEDETGANIDNDKGCNSEALDENKNKRKSCIKRTKISQKLLNELKAISETSDSDVDPVFNQTHNENSRSVSRLDSKSDRSENSPDSTIEFTQIRGRTNLVSPVKRLFATQLAGAGSYDIDNALTSAEPKQVCSETDPETECKSGLDTPKPLRRSLRIKTLQALLLGASSPIRNSTILAPETPDNENGWLLRKRQIFNCQDKRKN